MDIRGCAITHAVIVDDHALTRSGIRVLVQALDPAIEVVEASDVEQLVRAMETIAGAAVCLLDLDLHHTHGLQTLDRVRLLLPTVPVVVVSLHEEPDLVRACIEHGAMGYVRKSAPAATLTAALKRILRGEVYLPQTMYCDGADDAPVFKLTLRQRQVLGALVCGLPTKTIAADLHLSVYTVKEYLSEIYEVLGVHSRTQAVIKAGQMTIRTATALPELPRDAA